ncbi:MAG: TlpA family protein disulfide reductase [Microthrixaceae bacterium]
MSESEQNSEVATEPSGPVQAGNGSSEAPSLDGASPDGPSSDKSSSDKSSSDTPTATKAARRRLDPLSLAALTVVSLAIALFVTLIIVEVFGEDDQAVDVSEVVDEGSLGASQGRGALEVGQQAPDAELEGLDGTTIQLSSLRGSPAVINFWSSTCGPCLAEMPDLESVNQELDGQVRFLGIDVTDTVEAGRNMVQQTGVTYDNGRDPQAEVMGLYGGIALPRTVLVDSDGVVRAIHNGALSADELTESLQNNGLV